MQKIVPHLWYDSQAEEAANLYMTLFKNAKISEDVTIRNTPSGDARIITIDLAGQLFTLINAGPYFSFTPAISFLVLCSAQEEVDVFWQKIRRGGLVLMELDKYPFSEKYGWVEDKYGLSWQVMFTSSRKITQKIIPTLMFSGDNVGKAQEAINFYASIFENAEIGDIFLYGKDEEPNKEGTIKHASFTLEGCKFAAMDSAYDHHFSFNESVSFIVYCDTQKEIDHYWERLSAIPESEQCGWLKDRYGVSWQIVPTVMREMLKSTDEVKRDRITKAFLAMKKIDIAELERAYGERYSS